MEQDRIHIKLARRTPEERQADETRRLDPFMRALKAIHTAATPETMNVEDLEKQPDLVTLGAGESYQNTWIIRIEENV